jgi:DNA polymerase III subunit chi
MTEVLFYHLQNQRIENVLPALLERSLARGWRVIVQTTSEDRVDSLDAHLWTFRDDCFLPHGTERDASAAQQTVLLTTRDHNPNAANVRFLIDAAPLPTDVTGYERLVLLFDGDDPDAVAGAREHWTAVKAKGLAATYWQPDDQGRWHQKG